MNPILISNIFVFLTGLVALCLIGRHYTFYRRAEGSELARRMVILFASQIGNVLSVISYKFSYLFTHVAELILLGFQLFTALFSCWASFYLFNIYKKYK